MFLIWNYLFWVIFYRRIFCNLLAIPLCILYFVLYPFVKIRFIKLIGSALGHYAATTELLLSKIDEIKNDRFINIFYMEHNLFEPSICNSHLHKMWKRIIFILPLQFSGIIKSLDKVIMLFLAKKDYDMGGLKTRYESRWSRDSDNDFQTKPPHLKFTSEDHYLAKASLEKLNIKPGTPFICLFLRSSAYNKGHPTWNYPERNVDINTYMKGCHALTEKGYIVLRMGKVVDDTIPSNNPRIIDYARSDARSDFMDIYLSAHCKFFITTGSGLDAIAQIFRVPMVYTNCFILPHISTWFPHYLFTSKHLKDRTGRILSFKEQIDFFLHPNFVSRKDFHVSDYMKKNGLEFVDNTEDELLEIIEEMEARITNQWTETPTHTLLQSAFWDLFSSATQSKDKNKPLYGEIFIKMGASFLQRHQGLLSPSRG